MKYLSTFEAAEKWGVSPRRVGVLCNENRIPGAQRAGSRWIIPEDAEKPKDAHIKTMTCLSLVYPQKRHETFILAESIRRLSADCWKTGALLILPT